MNYQIAEDAKPQLSLLLWATVASIGLFVISWFFPLFSWIVYPLQLFATFVHEGSHVLAALISRSQVWSLTVSPDTSGQVWRADDVGLLGKLLISSAGYLGTTAFGAMLLIWMRYNLSSRIGLYFSAGFIGVMTLVFGLIFPIFNFTNITGIAFTVFSGLILMGVLISIAYYASLKWANFALAFLSVQCLLNALFNLKTLFLVVATTEIHNDAANMEKATNIPDFIWVFIWIGISVLMIGVGLRIYAVSQRAK